MLTLVGSPWYPRHKNLLFWFRMWSRMMIVTCSILVFLGLPHRNASSIAMVCPSQCTHLRPQTFLISSASLMASCVRLYIVYASYHFLNSCDDVFVFVWHLEMMSRIRNPSVIMVHHRCVSMLEHLLHISVWGWLVYMNLVLSSHCLGMLLPCYSLRWSLYVAFALVFMHSKHPTGQTVLISSVPLTVLGSATWCL